MIVRCLTIVACGLMMLPASGEESAPPTWFLQRPHETDATFGVGAAQLPEAAVQQAYADLAQQLTGQVRAERSVRTEQHANAAGVDMSEHFTAGTSLHAALSHLGAVRVQAQSGSGTSHWALVRLEWPLFIPAARARCAELDTAVGKASATLPEPPTTDAVQALLRRWAPARERATLAVLLAGRGETVAPPTVTAAQLAAALGGLARGNTVSLAVPALDTALRDALVAGCSACGLAVADTDTVFRIAVAEDPVQRHRTERGWVRTICTLRLVVARADGARIGAISVTATATSTTSADDSLRRARDKLGIECSRQLTGELLPILIHDRPTD